MRKTSNMTSKARLISSSMVLLGAMCIAGCNARGIYAGRPSVIEVGTIAEVGEEGGDAVDREMLVVAAREVLSDHRFVIDRVDARRGVVTTAYKSTQGLVSPWDSEQDSMTQEIADVLNQHERSVRVEVDEQGVAHVMVLVRRINRSGWQIETESIARSSRWIGIDSEGKREQSRVINPIGQDEQLAQRLAEEIADRVMQ